MRFLTPLSLLWAVPIVASIITLYLLKMRRLDLRVPATFLWPQMTSDLRANAPFQRLRFSVLLLLQLLAACLIVIALAGPLQRTRGLNGAATVVVLDDSASMQATDISPTRFENGIVRVRALINGMGADDRMALILAGAVTRIVFPLTGDKAEMDHDLSSLSPSDAPSDMADALRLASALTESKPTSRIIVLSDGNFDPVNDFSAGHAQLVYESIGTSFKNVAITSFNSALTPAGSLQCFAVIRSYDSSPMTVKAAFSVDSNIVDARQMVVPASSSTSLTFDAPANGRIAHLQIYADGDILPDDNQATIFLKGEGTVRTLLVTSGNLFLENALALDPAIRLEKAADVPDYELAGSPGPGRYDLVVFDNLPPRQVKAPAVMSLGIPDQQFGVTQNGVSVHPSVLDWSQTDPVMRFADLSGINILKADRVSVIAGSGGKVLASGSDGPLIVSSEQRGKRTLYASWSVLDSDFPLRVSFPIFVANSVAWLTTGQGSSAAESGGLTELTGKTFSISTPDESVTLTRPDGSIETLDGSSGAATVRSADMAGMYSVDGATTHTKIAVNILNETASDVRPKPYLDVAGTQTAATVKQNFILADFWKPFVVAVLLLLSAEWWLFVRRS